MKAVGVTVGVTNPKLIPPLTVLNNSNVVGTGLQLDITIPFSAPILTNSKIRLESTNLNLQGAFIDPTPQSKNIDQASTLEFTYNTILYDDPSLLRGIKLTNIQNWDRVEPGSIKVYVYDSANKIAQNSDPYALVYAAQTIDTSSITTDGTLLGASATIFLKYTTKIAYRANAIIYVKFPTEFGVTGSVITCTATGYSSASCTNNAQNLSLTGTSAVIPAGTEISINYTSIRLPYCTTPSVFDIKAQSSGFDHERGTATYSTAGTLKNTSLSIEPLTILSSVSSLDNEITMRFTHSVVYPTGTYFIVQLHPKISVSGSTTCAIQFGLTGATCTQTGTNTFRINNGFTSDRSASAGAIEIKFAVLKNPRGLGNYSIQIDVYTSGGCLFSSGSTNLSIDNIPTMKNVTLQVAEKNRNLYTAYEFSVTPVTTSIQVGDVLTFEMPSSILITPNVVCNKLSSNLQAISPNRVSDNVITVALTPNSAAYAVNQTMVFSMRLIRNPDGIGDFSGFIIRLADSLGNIYENYTNLVQTYTDFIVPTTAKAEFSNNLLGDDGRLTLTVSVSAFLVKNSKIELKLSDKFDVTQPSAIVHHISLATTSTQVALSSVDTTQRIVTFTLLSDYPSGTIFTIVANTKNPVKTPVSNEDMTVAVKTPDNKIVFQQTALSSSKSFICDQFCTACNRFFSICTDCESGYILSNSRCVLQTEHSQLFPPFIFFGIGVLLFFILLIVGKICGYRNYWGNMLFSLYQVDVFCFLIYFGYTWMTNSVNTIPRYLSYAIAAAHFVIGWIFFCFVKTALSSDINCSKNIEKNGHYIKTYPEDEEEEKEENLEKENYKLLNALLVFSLIISCALPRWLYSERSTRKGYIWYFPPVKFSKLRHTLELYQVVYFLGVMFPFAALCAYQLYYRLPDEWNSYLSEGVLIVFLNLVFYILAFCELLQSRRRAKKEEMKYTQPQESKVYAKEIKSGPGGALLDNTIRDDRPLSRSLSFDEEANKPQKPIRINRVEILNPVIIERKGQLTQSQLEPLQLVKDERDEKFSQQSSKQLDMSAITPSYHLKETQLNPFVITPNMSKIITPGLDSFDKGSPAKEPLTIVSSKPIVISKSAPRILKKKTLGKSAKDITVDVPTRQLTKTEYSEDTYLQKIREEPEHISPLRGEHTLTPEEHEPVRGSQKLDAAKVISVELVKKEDGVIRPQLAQRPTLRNEAAQSSSQKKKDESAVPDDHLKNKINYEDEDIVYTYPSVNVVPIDPECIIKQPEKSRFKENILFSKWWFANSTKRYLEIIYEEDEDNLKLHENLGYDSKSSHTIVSRKSNINEGSLDYMVPLRGGESEKSILTLKNKKINGQLESDLKKGILKDRKGESIKLDDQETKDPFKDGRFLTFENIYTIQMNTQNPSMFSKGLIKDNEGRLFRTIDQDFKEMQRGVTLRRDGNPDNIHGQKPEDLEKEILKDRDGIVLDLKKQSPESFEKGYFLLEKNGEVLKTHHPQNYEEMKVGLVRAPDRKQYRLKDQNFGEVTEKKIFRDINLNSVIQPSPSFMSKHLESASFKSVKPFGGESLTKVNIENTPVTPAFNIPADSTYRKQEIDVMKYQELTNKNPEISQLKAEHSKEIESSFEIFKYKRPSIPRMIAPDQAESLEKSFEGIWYEGPKKMPKLQGPAELVGNEDSFNWNIERSRSLSPREEYREQQSTYYRPTQIVSQKNNIQQRIRQGPTVEVLKASSSNKKLPTPQDRYSNIPQNHQKDYVVDDLYNDTEHNLHQQPSHNIQVVEFNKRKQKPLVNIEVKDADNPAHITNKPENDIKFKSPFVEVIMPKSKDRSRSNSVGDRKSEFVDKNKPHYDDFARKTIQNHAIETSPHYERRAENTWIPTHQSKQENDPNQGSLKTKNYQVGQISGTSLTSQFSKPGLIRVQAAQQSFDPQENMPDLSAPLSPISKVTAVGKYGVNSFKSNKRDSLDAFISRDIESRPNSRKENQISSVDNKEGVPNALGYKRSEYQEYTKPPVPTVNKDDKQRYEYRSAQPLPEHRADIILATDPGSKYKNSPRNIEETPTFTDRNKIGNNLKDPKGTESYPLISNNLEDNQTLSKNGPIGADRNLHKNNTVGPAEVERNQQKSHYDRSEARKHFQAQPHTKPNAMHHKFISSLPVNTGRDDFDESVYVAKSPLPGSPQKRPAQLPLLDMEKITLTGPSSPNYPRSIPLSGPESMNRVGRRSGEETDTMYLNLVMDESLDIDLNIEEIDDDDPQLQKDGLEGQAYFEVHEDAERGKFFKPRTRLAKLADKNMQPEEKSNNSKRHATDRERSTSKTPQIHRRQEQSKEPDTERKKNSTNREMNRKLNLKK